MGTWHKKTLLGALVCCLTLALTNADNPPFTVTKLDSPIRDTIWVGETDQVVFTITEGGHLWRSMDGGMNWVDQTAAGKLPDVTTNLPVYGQYVPPKGVQALLFHESAPNRIFLRGGADTHWVTDDFGDNYHTVKGPAGHLGFVAIRLHPTETTWMLVIARRWICWTADVEQKHACADDLFVTKDFGKTWTNMTELAKGRILSFVDFDWGWSKDPQAPQHKVYNKDTILAAVYENRPDVRSHLAVHGTAVVAGWDQYVDFVRSHDLFKTAHTKVVPCGNQFEIMKGQLFLAVAAQCGGKATASAGAVKMKISSDSGATFTDACFPVPLSERGYSVVDATPSAAYINVDYALGHAGVTFGDVFVSDANFTLFTTSLSRNTRSSTGAVDFAAVQGLPGLYIANQVELPQDQVAGRPGHSGGGGTVGTSEDEVRSHTTTKISLNGGATWETIRPPNVDSKGNTVNCPAASGCSLHLHGTTSWVSGSGFAFVYSHVTTPGLVIGTGNVGQYLYQDSTVNTYLSRDGGQTWEEMRKGAYIYEFGDSGGVILMARHGQRGSTSELLYSLDEGLTWETLSFAEEKEAVDVFNIRVEPDNVGKTFIIQGLAKAKTEGAERYGVLLAVNFGIGFSEYKVCGPNDYEWWTPSSVKCLLGQNISLQRQYRKAKCWNGDKYVQGRRSTPCPCEEEDYQCDFGMQMGNGKCQPMLGFEPATCPVLAKKAYAYSPAKKRLVAGDQCVSQIVEYGHYVDPARMGLPRWVTTGLAVLALLVVGGGAVAYLAYRGKLPDEWLQRMPYMEKLRYRNLRSNFQSLAQDFGLGGGDDDDDVEEMTRRPT